MNLMVRLKRILPRENDEINQEWLSDKARFFYDGLSNQRLEKPFVKKKNKLFPVIGVAR